MSWAQWLKGDEWQRISMEAYTHLSAPFFVRASQDGTMIGYTYEKDGNLWTRLIGVWVEED